MHTLIQLIQNYGYLFLFISLFLEMLALPLPNELVMSYIGYRVYQGQLDLWLALICGSGGCILGVSLSYLIGKKLGAPFFYKYGHYVHLFPERLDKLSGLFNSYGRGLLLITNFIPGVRHVIGYAAGISRIRYRFYALYAYTGSVLWVATFTLLGVSLGPKYRRVAMAAKEYFSVIVVVLLVALIVFYFIKYNRENIEHWVVIVYRSLFVNIQSRLRLKLLIMASALAFGVLLSVMFSLIDDFFHYRSLDFNQDGEVLLQAFVTPKIQFMLRQLLLLTKPWAVLIVCLSTGLWILLRGEQKKMELQMFLFLIIGGLFFSAYLPRWLGHLMGQVAMIKSHFSPDGALILTFVLYAYLIYLIARHTLHYILSILAHVAGGVIIAAAGIAALFFGRQLPSDLLIDYVLAGIWFSFIILCLEFWRLIAITDRQYHDEQRIRAQRKPN